MTLFDPGPPQEEHRKRQTLEQLPPDTRQNVMRVFEAWRQATGKTAGAKLSRVRLDKILEALSVYELQDVIDAATGIALSAFHMGDNDAGRKYDDITLALRNATNIERFRDLQRNPPKKKDRRPPIRSDWENTPSGIVDPRSIIHRD